LARYARDDKVDRLPYETKLPIKFDAFEEPFFLKLHRLHVTIYVISGVVKEKLILNNKRHLRLCPVNVNTIEEPF